MHIVSSPEGCVAGSIPFLPEKGSSAEESTDLVWSFAPDSTLPNVLLLGDSISIGYTLPVRKLLRGKANVFRPITLDGQQAVNCEGTTAGVQKLDDWLAGRLWDVIHFNWGLHDLKHLTAIGEASNDASDPVQAPLEIYGENLEAIVKKLKLCGARLIFATTTPVAPGTTHPYRHPNAPSQYNAVALKIMASHGVRINDLYAECVSRLDEVQRPQNVHFTDAGSEFLAQRVAAVIKAELLAMG